MTSISGTIRIGEATPTVKATIKRQRGSMWPFHVLAVLVWLIGAVTGHFIARYFGYYTIIGTCTGAVAGLLAYRPFGRVLAKHRFRKILTGKGVPLDLPARMELAPDSITYALGGVTSTAKWDVVSELFFDKGWWIFIVQSQPWFAADRFFASDADKRAFLSEALSHMSEEARARSGDAVKFVDGGKA